MIEERYELALDRIRLMQTEDTVKEPYRDYFKKMAEFVLMLDELRDELLDGRYQKFTLEELRTWNRRLYQDVLPEQYEESYACTYRSYLCCTDLFYQCIQSCFRRNSGQDFRGTYHFTGIYTGSYSGTFYRMPAQQSAHRLHAA